MAVVLEWSLENWPCLSWSHRKHCRRRRGCRRCRDWHRLLLFWSLSCWQMWVKSGQGRVTAAASWHKTHDAVESVSGYVFLCLSVCHAALLGFAMQKRLNGLTSCLGWRLLGKHCIIRNGRSPHPPTAMGGFDAAFAKLLSHLFAVLNISWAPLSVYHLQHHLINLRWILAV